MKRIITETELNDIIEESVEKVLGEICYAHLDEMARVGFIGGEYEVYVWTDDSGYIPHVHVRDTNSRGKRYETCVKLESNEYFLHGHYKDKMNSSMRKAFNAFMNEPCKNNRYQNNYDFAVDMWNSNNSSATVTPQYDENGKIVVPDYTSLDD